MASEDAPRTMHQYAGLPSPVHDPTNLAMANASEAADLLAELRVRCSSASPRPPWFKDSAERGDLIEPQRGAETQRAA